MAIVVRASVPPGSSPSSEEIVAKAYSHDATRGRPEGFCLVEDPGLVACAFAGLLAQLEYMTENAGSESGARHGQHFDAQRVAPQMGSGRFGSAAGVVTGVGAARVQPWVWGGIRRGLIEQGAMLPRVRSARAPMAVHA